MKKVSTRLGSMIGLFAVVAGCMAVACSAAPEGSIGGGQDNQTAGDKNKLPAQSTSPTNPTNGTNANPSNPSNPSNPTPSDPTNPTPATDGGTTPTPTPTPTGDPQVCAASADFQGCFDCCDQQNAGGFDVDAQAWNTCACQANVCGAACGNNFCAGQDPSAACEQCLGSDTTLQCDQQAETACQASAACSGAMTCIETAKCFDKP
jgi:hypothetical protein